MPIVHIQSKKNFAETAETVLQCLLIEKHELRDGENYPGGYYYKGEVGDFKVTIYAEDKEDPVFADCQFQVCLTVASDSSTDEEEAAELMIEELLRAGFPTMREKEHTDREVKVERYELAPSGQLLIKTETRKLV